MSKRTTAVFPRERQRTEALGERIQLARLRRGVPQTEMAIRAGVSRGTIAKLEVGDPSVGLSVLLRTLDVLGLADDLEKIAADDAVGRNLADLGLSRSPRTRRAR